MKLKLAQRIAIKYYRTKFQALSLISKRKAAESVFTLFCTPYSGKPRRVTPAVFEKAERLHFSLNNISINGWRWHPAHFNGKKILIVHGFDSCSYKFEQYIHPLMHAGFEVLAFDAPGHGISGGKTINALMYSHAILKMEQLYGSFYGIMAHSLGGLAAALAFEHLPHQQQRRLALIAPTTETHSAIDNFFRFLQVPRHLRPHLESVIETVGQNSIAHYSVKRVVQQVQGRLLWLHDESDFICPYADTLPVQKLQLPHVEFFITKGLGHSGIYKNKPVFEKIMAFFTAD